MANDNEIQLTNTIFYIGDEGAVKGEFLVDVQRQTLWANQKSIADLFNVDRTVITKHLKNIFKEGELDENSTSAKIAHVQNEGNRKINRTLKFYNLDAIISVGYRVNSIEATQFRIWATNKLKEFIIKGFVLDDELLKNGTRFGVDYFENLLERIRNIRSSERRFNQKITDIYSTSYDYNKDTKTTKEFFATVQNKLIYAVSGHTAAEIIVERVDSSKQYMGLTNWKNPNDKILMSDVII